MNDNNLIKKIMIYTMNKYKEVTGKQPTPKEIRDMIKHRRDRIGRETAVIRHSDSEQTDIQNVTSDDDKVSG